MRFKIRHAHIPAYGSPWPMPHIYHPHTTVYRIVPRELQFRVVGGESCPILEQNFRRISRNMFGENPVEDGAANSVSDFSGFPLRLLRVIRWMNITVIKECTEFPYLEMDESCAYLLTDVISVVNVTFLFNRISLNLRFWTLIYIQDISVKHPIVLFSW